MQTIYDERKVSEQIAQTGAWHFRKKRGALSESVSLLERTLLRAVSENNVLKSELDRVRLELDVMTKAKEECKAIAKRATTRTRNVTKVTLDKCIQAEQLKDVQISQRKFAQLSGISRSTVQRKFAGKKLTAELAQKVKDGER